MKSAHRTRAAGFTLVEMLVVITIITVLAALLVPAAYIVLNNAENARLAIEVAGLTQAMETFKSEYGDYPPDCSDTAEVNKFLSRMFPRRNPTNDPLPSGLTPATALSFWLGGFSADPTKPITGAGDRKPRFDFDETRADFVVGAGTNDNVKVFAYHPRNKLQPYVYLQWKTYGSATYTTAVNGTARAYYDARDVNGQTLIYPRKFQIICAGQDDHYGGGGARYPDGPYNISEDLDNITNFSGGKTLEDQIPGL